MGISNKYILTLIITNNYDHTQKIKNIMLDI